VATDLKGILVVLWKVQQALGEASDELNYLDEEPVPYEAELMRLSQLIDEIQEEIADAGLRAAEDRIYRGVRPEAGGPRDADV
jgi:hypothetical protein